MDRVSWFAAMHFANWRSEHADPPLSPCYVLDGCEGITNNPDLCVSGDCTAETEYIMYCDTVTVNTPTGSAYDCEGYRLPTDAEWEYAARAGSRTTYFMGQMSAEVATDPDLATHEPALDDYAWYYHNNLGSAQAVGHKGANAWGLHDVLGNVCEFVSNPRYVTTEEAPATDPWGTLDASTGQATIRGGRHGSSPSMLRVAQRLTSTTVGTVSGGFRLVRTLPSE
jgi:formylglycine-generating enzyme required for sulfatase activity